jgi:replicative DNA helicase
MISTIQSLAMPEAEQSVIGSVFLQDSADEVMERLAPHHFADPVNQRIWAAIKAERRKGPILDPIAVHGALGADDGYIKLGGLQHLMGMVEKAPTWALEAHVGVVLERAARRAIVSVCEQGIRDSHDTGFSEADAIIADLERGVAEISKDGTSKPKAVPVGLTAMEMVEAAYRGDFKGASVGLGCLDQVTGGIRQDSVWFIGGRPVHGQVGRPVSRPRHRRAGRGVMMFSLEMPLREVQARLISDIAYDPASPTTGRTAATSAMATCSRAGDTQKQKDRARKRRRALASLPLSVTDEGGLTIDDIRLQAQRQMRAWEKAGVERGAILIDHIGLVKPTRRSDSKAAETADTVNELKSLAKYLAPRSSPCARSTATPRAATTSGRRWRT